MLCRRLETRYISSRLTNKYVATGSALLLAFAVAMIPGPGGAGTGGMILWPLFGATNQLLAGLAFLVTVFYLWRRGKPIWFAAVPMSVMLVMPAWAMGYQIFNTTDGWLGLGEQAPNYLLLAFGSGILLLQIWIVVEAFFGVAARQRRVRRSTATAGFPASIHDSGPILLVVVSALPLHYRAGHYKPLFKWRPVFSSGLVSGLHCLMKDFDRLSQNGIAVARVIRQDGFRVDINLDAIAIECLSVRTKGGH